MTLPRVRPRVARSTAAVLLALLAGCGTTLPDAGTLRGSSEGVDLGPSQRQGVDPEGAVPTAAPVDLTPGASSAGGLQAGSDPGSQITTPTSEPVPLSAGGPATGRGFTRTTVEIGVATADDFNAFAGAVGIQGVTAEGDPLAQLNAVVADVNRRGGLAGRKIVLVKHDFNTAETLSDPATANQAACADWTQDHKVYAVLAPPVVEDTLLECLKKTGTPVIYGGGIEYPVHYAATYAKYPLFFNVAQMVGERYDRISIRRLVARKFFSPWDTINGRPGTAPMKLGLVMADDHDGDVALASKKRELARYGITPTDVIRCPRAIQSAVACQQSAVLKLRQDGITHLYGVGYPFMVNADKQQYRPRYFLGVEPRVYAENAPASQLVGSMAESYLPVMDVEATEYPGDPNPAAAYCRKIMRAAGEASSDPTTLWVQFTDCDVVFFLKAAVDATGALGADLLRQGFELLGSRTPSALTWGTWFGPGEHTSATVLRDLEFRTDINRFAFVGKTNHGDR